MHFRAYDERETRLSRAARAMVLQQAQAVDSGYAPLVSYYPANVGKGDMKEFKMDNKGTASNAVANVDKGDMKGFEMDNERMGQAADREARVRKGTKVPLSR